LRNICEYVKGNETFHSAFLFDKNRCILLSVMNKRCEVSECERRIDIYHTHKIPIILTQKFGEAADNFPIKSGLKIYGPTDVAYLSFGYETCVKTYPLRYRTWYNGELTFVGALFVFDYYFNII